jgi:nitrous oxidase accessory protein NosD
VSVHHGNNVQVLRSDISRGGDMGIHGTLVNVGLIQGNHIHDNNTDQFSPEWGAGGVKVTEVHDFTIDSNEVDNNAAPGLWCDISCQGVTIANNRVHHNQWQGIIFEISDKAAIHDNVVWQNGWNAPTWGWGAGILVSSSADAEVYNNTVAWNKAGISVIDLNRPDRVTPVNNYVHDNVIVRNTIASGDAWSGLSLAWLNDGTGRLFDPTANNRGANNRYWYDQPEGNGIRGSWQQQYQQLADLQATPGNQGGRYLSDDEQSQLLASHAVPAAGGPA